MLIEICFDCYIKSNYVVVIGLDQGSFFHIGDKNKSLLFIWPSVRLGELIELRNITALA